MKLEGTVKLFKDRESMGVETSCSDPDVFCKNFCVAITSLMEQEAFVVNNDGNPDDWQYQLERWIPNAFEVLLKLKGYKSLAVEEKIIRSGVGWYGGDSLIYEAGDVPENPALKLEQEEKKTA